MKPITISLTRVFNSIFKNFIPFSGAISLFFTNYNKEIYVKLDFG
jgi:hypothetical protein